jgi:phosphopantothenoylcysteine decarboxylase/phosphopantothenate--cysteine ligase
VGRLAEPAEILVAIEEVLSQYTPHSLDGLRVLVTAGGTREPIDSVRFIGNRSSGRMGLALADFRPAAVAEGKLAREGEGDARSGGFALELQPTADIVAAVAAGRRPDQTVVGFAAEHGEGAVERGRAKLSRKGLDAVVVNDISRPDIGFDSADNEVTIVLPDGEREVGRRPKAEVAAAILDEVEALRARGTVEAGNER